MKNDSGRDHPVSVIASDVAEKVQVIYKKASISYVTKKEL